jgi:hypothetical protein
VAGKTEDEGSERCETNKAEDHDAIGSTKSLMSIMLYDGTGALATDD